MEYTILSINLGTTSTRAALHRDETMLGELDLTHDAQELQSFTQEQHVANRKKMLADWLVECGVSIKDVHAVALRIPNLPKSILGGVLAVDEAVRGDLMALYAPEKHLRHGSNIVLPLADAICEGSDIPCYIVEPANQNDMIPEARVSGHPLFQRETIFHALNQKSVARLQAEALGKTYGESNFIVAHLGGGISVSAHQKGRVTDTNNCAGEDGAFSGNRTGTLPARQLVQLCFSGKFTFEQVLGMMLWKGGVSAYLGTSDMREVEKRAAEGDEQADLMYRTVAYRTAKEIGGLCAVIDGELDGIILTGGMANSKRMCQMITDYVGKFAPITIYAGERESDALAGGVLRILRGEETLAQYPVDK